MEKSKTNVGNFRFQRWKFDCCLYLWCHMTEAKLKTDDPNAAYARVFPLSRSVLRVYRPCTRGETAADRTDEGLVANK